MRRSYSRSVRGSTSAGGRARVGKHLLHASVARELLQTVLDNQLSAANLSRFDFKSMAQETWDAFSEPYTIAQEGMEVHFYSVPNKLKVREEITLDQKLTLYLGLEGEVISKIGSKP